MKTIYLLLVTIAVCYGQPIPIPVNNNDGNLVSISSVLPNNEHYNFVIETSDGTYRHETGYYKKVGLKDVLIATGHYAYLDEHDNLHEVNYDHDELGFRLAPVRRAHQEPAVPAIQQQSETEDMPVPSKIYPAMVKAMMNKQY